MDEVRRDDDGELCGHVDERDGRWLGLTVFGVTIGSHHDRLDAEQQTLTEGLASLAERWTLRHGDIGDTGATRVTDDAGEEEIVCIQEADTMSVTVARWLLPDVRRPDADDHCGAARIGRVAVAPLVARR